MMMHWHINLQPENSKYNYYYSYKQATVLL